MLLVNLLKDIKEINQLNLKEFNPLIKGISFNSKKIKKNFIFVAIKGKRYDGHQFVNEAINKGAILIIIDNKKPIKILIKKKINFIFCKNSRILLSKISSNFFPKQPSFISAVTGTNGKTSVSHITKEIWKNCNISSAAIGTIGLITDRYKKKLPLTTIDSIQLHQILTSLYKKKINHLCIEASSHGLEQNRIDNIKINTAAFTNFSHDHLDYHKNFKLYFKSKMRLFKDLLIRNGNAIINSDIPESKTIQKLCKKYNKKVISYGFKSKYLQLLDYKSEKDYQKVYFKYKKTKFNFTLPLFGDFQIYNALCSIGIILSSGIGIKECIKSIKKINQIPGRLEKINIPKKQKATIPSPEDYDEVRILVYTQPNKLSTGKKKPELMEISLGGKKEDQLKFIKEHEGKDIILILSFSFARFIEACAAISTSEPVANIVASYFSKSTIG